MRVLPVSMERIKACEDKMNDRPDYTLEDLLFLLETTVMNTQNDEILKFVRQELAELIAEVEGKIK